MKLRQIIKLALGNIIANKLRTFLTMLGMIVGVASVITLVSLMTGFTNQLLSDFIDSGVNTIAITNKGNNRVLKQEDAINYAEKNPDTILGIVPNVTAVTSVKNGTKVINDLQITGIDENTMRLSRRILEAGMPITYSDIQMRKNAVVIGSYINQQLFQGQAKIGDVFSIGGYAFTVQGILKEQSDSSEWSKDNVIYIPYTTAIRIFGNGTVSNYTAYVKNTEDVGAQTIAIASYIQDTLGNGKYYEVTNMIEFLKQFESNQALLTSLIAGIAGISLFVAGIGIMNIMLVSVTERTREIGIRKALGAKHRDIMRQFLIEAGTTSCIGGMIGIIIGIILAINIGAMLKMEVDPPLSILLISFTISFGIGVLFGYLPAKKAAKLNPIDALKSE